MNNTVQKNNVKFSVEHMESSFKKYMRIDDAHTPVRIFEILTEYSNDVDATLKKIVLDNVLRKRADCDPIPAIRRILEKYVVSFREEFDEDVIPCIVNKTDNGYDVVQLFCDKISRNQIDRTYASHDALVKCLLGVLYQEDKEVEYSPDPIGLTIQGLINGFYKNFEPG